MAFYSPRPAFRAARPAPRPSHGFPAVPLFPKLVAERPAEPAGVPQIKGRDRASGGPFKKLLIGAAIFWSRRFSTAPRTAALGQGRAQW